MRIVLDDGSTDTTVDLITAVADARIRVHVNEVNLDLPTTINIGLALARGDHVARMDHDDTAHPQRLRLQSAYLDLHPEIMLVGSQIEHFHDESAVTDFPLDDGDIKAQLLTGERYVANPTTMFRADFVRAARLRFDPNLYVVDDLGFLFDCALAGGRFANLPDVLLKYRMHAGMTSKNLEIDRLFKSKKRLFSRILVEYFPNLTADDCNHLLNLYQFDDLAPDDMQAMRPFCRAAGRAMSLVNGSIGQDTKKVRDYFSEMITARLDYMILEKKNLTLSEFQEDLEPIYLTALNRAA